LLAYGRQLRELDHVSADQFVVHGAVQGPTEAVPNVLQRPDRQPSLAAVAKGAAAWLRPYDVAALCAALAGLSQLVDPLLDIAARQACQVPGAQRRADVEADEPVVVVDR